MTSELARNSRANRIAIIGIVLAALYVIGMLNYWVPTLRFRAPLANALTFSAFQLIPFILFVFALAARPWWARILWCIPLVPLAAFAGILGSGGALQSVSIVANAVDASFERLDVVPLPAGHLAIYRTNGGGQPLPSASQSVGNAN